VRQLSSSTADVQFPRSLYDCAIFLKSTTPLGTTVQFCGYDPYQFMATCSERFPYISVLTVHGNADVQKLNERVEAFRKLKFGTFEEAKALCRKLRIDWLVFEDSDTNNGAFNGSVKPAFVSGDYKLFKMSERN
jgi:hypothetical protein